MRFIVAVRDVLALDSSGRGTWLRVGTYEVIDAAEGWLYVDRDGDLVCVNAYDRNIGHDDEDEGCGVMSEGLMADQRDYAEEADNRAEMEDAAAEAVQQCERLHCTKDMHKICCSSHGKALCHECYRRTHFVEVCVEGCDGCQKEGLPVYLYRKAAAGA